MLRRLRLKRLYQEAEAYYAQGVRDAGLIQRRKEVEKELEEQGKRISFFFWPDDRSAPSRDPERIAYDWGKADYKSGKALHEMPLRVWADVLAAWEKPNIF